MDDTSEREYAAFLQKPGEVERSACRCEDSRSQRPRKLITILCVLTGMLIMVPLTLMLRPPRPHNGPFPTDMRDA